MFFAREVRRKQFIEAYLRNFLNANSEVAAGIFAYCLEKPTRNVLGTSPH